MSFVRLLSRRHERTVVGLEQLAVLGWEILFQGAEHPLTLTSTTELTNLYQLQGKFADAERLYRGYPDVFRRVVGPAHPDTLESLDMLATVYWRQGRLKEAQPLFEEVLDKRRKVLGPEHASTVDSMNNLALV